MSRINTGGYGHWIRARTHFGEVYYTVSWQYDVKYGRVRYPRSIHREVTREGAERFAKKWGVPMPAEETP